MHLVQDDVNDGLSVPPVDVLDEGSCRLTQAWVYEVPAVKMGLPQQSSGRLAVGEPDQKADVGEHGRHGGGLSAVPHCASEVVGHYAAVVDGRTEGGQIARGGFGDRGRCVDDSFNGHLPARNAINLTATPRRPISANYRTLASMTYQ